MTKKRKKKDKGMDSGDFLDYYINNYPAEFARIPAFLIEADKEHTKRLPPTIDKNQSWKVVKGKGLEKVVEYILNLELANTQLELRPVNELMKYLELDFAQYGRHIPDVDLAVFQPSKDRVLAILSVKSSLRERSTHTAYWRFKMHAFAQTRDIKVFLITPNSDNILLKEKAPNKPRAVLENDIDGTYIVHEAGVALDDYVINGTQSRIKLVEQLVPDLLDLANR